MTNALFSNELDAMNAAVALADLNGAPVRVAFDGATRGYFIDEMPDSEWASSVVEVALIEPTEVAL